MSSRSHSTWIHAQQVSFGHSNSFFPLKLEGKYNGEGEEGCEELGERLRRAGSECDPTALLFEVIRSGGC